MDALDGRPKAETIKTVCKLREWTLDARKTLLDGYAEGHSHRNLGAMIWLQSHGNRTPMLLGATDFFPFRPKNPVDPHHEEYIDMANVVLAWCDQREPVGEDPPAESIQLNDVQNTKPATPEGVGEFYVTLLQMSAIVNKSKRTLERLRDDGKLKAPAVKGGDGKADEWRWSEVRPILQKVYSRKLPEEFPSDRFMRR